MGSLTPRLDKLDKNYIINGNFDYWQRSTSASITGGYVAADRFRSNHTGGSGTISRSTDVPDTNSTYSAQVAVTSAVNPQISHIVESVFARQLANRTITFKIKVKAVDSTNTPIKVAFATAVTLDTYAGYSIFDTKTISASPTADQWITYSVTVAVPGSAVNGFIIAVYRDSGVTPVTTTTRYSQMQVILGEHIDPDYCYAGRDVVEELSLCQRYYEKSYDIDTIPGTSTSIGAMHGLLGAAVGAGAGWGLTSIFKTTKRAIPAVVYYAIGGAGQAINVGGSIFNTLPTYIGTGSVIPYNNTGSTQGAAGQGLSAHWIADAELA